MGQHYNLSDTRCVTFGTILKTKGNKRLKQYTIFMIERLFRIGKKQDVSNLQYNCK